MKYLDELTRTMTWLGEQPNTVFIGQNMINPGIPTAPTLAHVDRSRMIEFPVAEEMQMGVTLGMALDGRTIPISVFPRWNFMLCAMSQLINHIDKVSTMSDYQVKTIIRVLVGTTTPMNPQCQHIGDFTAGLRHMVKTLDIITLDEPEEIFPAYELALNRDDNRSTVLVEYQQWYREK